MRKTELKRKTPLKRTAAEKEWAKPRRANPLKKGPPSRAWAGARAKVDIEGVCRLAHADDPCEGPLEAAHVVGREHDEPSPVKPSVLFVHPDRIAPLCRRHHRLYDDHERDLLGRLLRDEEVQAVRDVGLENARVRTCPSEYGARRVVSEGEAA